jgi:hypothetical protein
MGQLNGVTGVAVCVLFGLTAACADSGSDVTGEPADEGSWDGSSSGGSKATGGSKAGGGSSSGGSTGTGGSPSDSAESGGATTAGGTNANGGAEGGTGGSKPLAPDPCIAQKSCPPGQWIDVTPSALKSLGFGPGPVVLDPAAPSDLYVGGGGDGVWKSTDYGNTWAQINTTIPGIAMGYVMAVLPTSPRTVLVAGYKKNFKSKDGGVTFSELPFDFPESLYSIQVDPYSPTHLVSGLHEVDGIVESTDSGDTWHYVGKSGFPSGGMSWYAFFVDTGSASTTKGTWLAIGQGGGTAMTTSGGDSWTVPQGVNGLVHGHGNAQILQQGNTLYLPGTYGPGHGLYKSTDLGSSFTRIYDGTMAVAWGTEKNLYAMWAWACSGCDFGTGFFITAPLPGATPFAKPATPAGMRIGANHVAVTSDGNHNIFVGTMWADGIWRYVEP